MKKLSEGFTEAFPVLPSAFCLLIMVRLKDIAQFAGVSVMTVSKALRNEPDVSAATKVRIKQLAQQMGYVPDSTAQGLRTRTTKLFGLVIPSITNPIYARIVFALEERAHELGYDILLAHTHNVPAREENLHPAPDVAARGRIFHFARLSL